MICLLAISLKVSGSETVTGGADVQYGNAGNDILIGDADSVFGYCNSKWWSRYPDWWRWK